MFSKKEEPRLLIPALKPFYDRVIPLSWVVVRFAVGWNSCPRLLQYWARTVGVGSGFREDGICARECLRWDDVSD